MKVAGGGTTLLGVNRDAGVMKMKNHDMIKILNSKAASIRHVVY